jgi:hypothetical protein
MGWDTYVVDSQPVPPLRFDLGYDNLPHWNFDKPLLD